MKSQIKMLIKLNRFLVCICKLYCDENKSFKTKILCITTCSFNSSNNNINNRLVTFDLALRSTKKIEKMLFQIKLNLIKIITNKNYFIFFQCSNFVGYFSEGKFVQSNCVVDVQLEQQNLIQICFLCLTS